MRKSLFTAVAAAPLLLLAASPAMAQVTISDAHTTPVNTSTANSGQPADVTITGSVTVTGPVAVTLDSNNKLTNGGSITITDVNDSTGVLLLGGHTGTFTNSGSISIGESYVPTDTNNTKKAQERNGANQPGAHYAPHNRLDTATPGSNIEHGRKNH